LQKKIYFSQLSFWNLFINIFKAKLQIWSPYLSQISILIPYNLIHQLSPPFMSNSVILVPNPEIEHWLLVANVDHHVSRHEHNRSQHVNSHPQAFAYDKWQNPPTWEQEPHWVRNTKHRKKNTTQKRVRAEHSLEAVTVVQNHRSFCRHAVLERSEEYEQCLKTHVSSSSNVESWLEPIFLQHYQ